MTKHGALFVSLFLGLALPVFIPNSLQWPILALFVVLCIPLMFVPVLRLPSLLILGFCITSLHLQYRIAQQLPLALEGKDLVADINIVGLPEVDGRVTRFVAELTVPLEGSQQVWRGRVRLSWYYAPSVNLNDGWRVVVRLKKPRGFVNGSGFDYQAWLLSQRIFASGYVRKSPENIKLTKHKKWYVSFSDYRKQLQKNLFENREFQFQKIMQALLLGDKSALKGEDWMVLQRTGTIHLMAISGLHIGLIAGFGFVVGRFFSRTSNVLDGARWVYFLLPPILSTIFAFVYAGLAGFSIPTQRALMFVCVVNLAVAIGRRLNYFLTLLLCAIAVVMLDPFALLSPGFYLSFLAVTVLFYCFLGYTPTVFGWRNKLTDFFRAQILLFIGLFTPLILLALPVSPGGIFANCVAVPIVSLLLVPLLFISGLVVSFSNDLAHVILVFCDIILQALWSVLVFFSQFTLGSLRVALPNGLSLTALFFAACVLLSPRMLALRTLSLPLLLVAFFSLDDKQNTFRLTSLDVGQGLAVFIEWPDGNLLYDTGARFSEDFDIGSRVIAPWLHSRAQTHLHYLFVSHSDNDHAGGMHGLLQSVSVDEVFVGPTLNDKDVLPPSAKTCMRGMAISRGEATIQVLWPRAEGVAESETNNSSCVVLVSYRGKTVLLSGDIERKVEQALLAEGVLPRNIDVLVAPHHGSRTSSSAAFVEHLNPKRVVFSVGYRNRYHHPNAQVLDRYRQQGSEIYRTDYDGAVTYRIEEDLTETSTKAREANRRPWFW